MNYQEWLKTVPNEIRLSRFPGPNGGAGAGWREKA
jgi:hypothetical protein